MSTKSKPTGRSSRQETQTYWKNHFLAYKTSGLSKTAYCNQNQLSSQSFSYWIRKLSASSPQKINDMPSDDFLPVRIQPDSLSRSENKVLCILEIGKQHRLLIHSAVVLETALQALENVKCL